MSLSKGLIQVLVLILLLVGLGTGVILVKNPQIFKPRAQSLIKEKTPELQSQATRWLGSQDSFRAYKTKQPTKILEVSLNYNKDASPQISIGKVQIKNGYPSSYPSLEKGYKLQIINQNRENLYTLTFEVPNEVRGTFELETDTDIYPEPLLLDQIDFVFTIPWFENAVKVRILDPNNKKISEASLLNIPQINNQSSFYSITGKDLLESSDRDKVTKQTERLQTEETFGNDPRYVDITFISSNYHQSELNKFHQDVNEFGSYLITFEPFKTRASQVLLHYVDNTRDLNCRYVGRLLLCAIDRAIRLVNDAGTPYDVIIIIHNSEMYGGAAYASLNVATTYNGTYGRQVFTHELGHAFGNLKDEYVVVTEDGQITNRVYNNCYSGTPPAVEWRNIVAMRDYALECAYRNWYRSSPQSIMRNSSAPYFNAVSQIVLNQKFNFYAVPFLDSTNPTVTINSPSNGDTVSGEVTIKTSASDNNGVVWVEFWRDEELYSTTYLSPYEFSWDVRDETEGPHHLTVKAYDATGNSASAEVNVFVYHSAPTPTPRPTVTPTPTPTSTPTPSPSPTPIPGDFNQDGRVDILDLRYVLSNFTNIFDYNLVVKNFADF